MGDIVSRTKFFADIPGGGLSGGTSKLLEKVAKADVKDNSNVEVLTAVGVEQGAGFRDIEGGGEITLQVYRETGTPEVNWYFVKFDRKILTFTMQDEQRGMRFAFTCRVATVDPSSDNQGVHEYAVKLVYSKIRVTLAAATPI